MKKRRNALIQLGILLALGAAVIGSLVLPRIPGGQVVAQPVELSVLIRETDSTLWSNARLGMEQAAGELGGELRFLTLTALNDPAEQEELLRREAEGGADVLVVVPADPVSLAEELEELAGQRPVVSMESQLEGAALTVAPDNGALGKALALAVLEDWSGGTVLLLDTAGTSAGVGDRLEAARQELEKAGVPVQVRQAQNGTLANALEGLVNETNAGQIMSFEPAATERAAEGKESWHLDKPLYGVGVTAKIAAWLERGTVSAVAAWSDYAAGYLAVEGAIRTVQGTPYAVEPLPFSVVRGEDIYDPDNQKLLFPVTS